MTVLTAADYADTGQWRLNVRIYKTGMNAYLENTLHDDVDIQYIFKTEWDDEESSLLTNIENAVYDHPRILDDFAVRITVYDDKTLFIPTQVIEEKEGIEEKAYNDIFGCEPDDMIIVNDRDVTAVCHLTNGLRSFLNRTFPGARVTVNLFEKFKNLKTGNQGTTLFIVKRENEADLILMDWESLVSASTRKFSDEKDLAYHSFNLFDVFQIDPTKVKVKFFGKIDNPEVSGLFSNKCRNLEIQEAMKKD